jgi:hypothetical protein
MRRGAGLRDARPGSPFFIRRHAGGARIARRLRPAFCRAKCQALHPDPDAQGRRLGAGCQVPQVR